MAAYEERLRRMVHGARHHQPAPAPSRVSFFNRAGTSTAAAVPMPSQQGYQSSNMVAPPSPPPVAGQDQYTEFLALAAVDLAKKGARLHGSLPSYEMVAGYKRKRDEQAAPVLGMAHPRQQKQTIVMDRLLLNHASEMWKALAEQRQKEMRFITSTAEDKAAKQLKAKDDEIKNITCLNWALWERLRNLQKEAQMWRDVARFKEAAALVLRGDLQSALEAQAVRDRGLDRAIDDARSCCWGDNQAVPSVGTCKGCGNGEAVELLLPCRHLCACTLCAATAQACPGCGCAKTGSIRINFS